MENNARTRYLKTLFNPGESLACQAALDDAAAVPLSTALDSSPQWVSVNPIKVWRSSKNVTAYRNLVIEFDQPGVSIDDQLTHVIDSKFPFSTAVFSGNKSVHFVCALTEPLTFEEFVEARLYLDILFPSSDKSMKDPARLTRAAGGINAATNTEQSLLLLGNRVKPDRLATWFLNNSDILADEIERRHEAEQQHLATRAALAEAGQLSASSWRFLNGEEGVRQGGTRHARLYAVMCDVCDIVGASYADALEIANKAAQLQGITDDPKRLDEANKIVYDVYYRRSNR